MRFEILHLRANVVLNEVFSIYNDRVLHVVGAKLLHGTNYGKLSIKCIVHGNRLYMTKIVGQFILLDNETPADTASAQFKRHVCTVRAYDTDYELIEVTCN